MNAQIRTNELQMLQYLNTRPGKSEALTVLKEKYYDPAAIKEPQRYAKYSFEQFIDFLEKKLLITKVDHSHYGISVFGRDFLVYLTKNGLF